MSLEPIWYWLVVSKFYKRNFPTANRLVFPKNSAIRFLVHLMVLFKFSSFRAVATDFCPISFVASLKGNVSD